MAGTVEVDRLLDRARDLPYGEARTVLAEEALRRAEPLGDHNLTMEARLELTKAYEFGGEPAKSFVTFSRSVTDYYADPGRYKPYLRFRLLWQFKWIVGEAGRFPEVPLRRAHDLLEEMERRYREAGYGLHPVYAERCQLAQHVGDLDAAEEWFRRWHTAPRNELSDCAACDPGSKVWFLTANRRDEEALRIAEPVLAGRLTCHAQPQSMLTGLLQAYVRTGHGDLAAAAHRRAYPLILAKATSFGDIASHIEFCALTGNEARGLEMLQHDGPPLERAPSPEARMWFAASTAVLLRRLVELGRGETVILREGREVTAAGLHAEMEAEARAVAVRFDARNGTAWQSTMVERTMAAEPLVDRLPLGPPRRAG